MLSDRLDCNPRVFFSFIRIHNDNTRRRHGIIICLQIINGGELLKHISSALLIYYVSRIAVIICYTNVLRNSSRKLVARIAKVYRCVLVSKRIVCRLYDLLLIRNSESLMNDLYKVTKLNPFKIFIACILRRFRKLLKVYRYISCRYTLKLFIFNVFLCVFAHRCCIGLFLEVGRKVTYEKLTIIV